MSPFPIMNWFEALPSVERLSLAVVVDGGATGSRAALAEIDGTLRGYAEGGPTSGRAVGNDTALVNLIAVVAAAVDDADITFGDVDYCLVMSAAVDTKRHSAFLCEGISREVVPRGAVAAVPDTLGCWAVTNGLEPAVAAIAGTGSVVLVGDLTAGLCHRLGGWDFLIGDEGSGFGIGRAVLRETMLVGEGRSSAVDLAEICLGMLAIKHPDELPDRVTKHIDKAMVASLAEVALSLAAEGHAVARNIVTDQVRMLVELVSQGAAPLAGGPVHVGQFGGLFKSTYYSSVFGQLVTDSLGVGTALLTPRLSAISGGLSLVLWRAGVPPDDISLAALRIGEELTRRQVGTSEA